MADSSDTAQVEVLYVGGSTALVKMGGLQLVIDPTFDPSGEPTSAGPYRIDPPALTVEQLPAIDVALVSHDEHPDNLDASGKALLGRIDTVVTTPSGAERLGGGARGLEPFDDLVLSRPDGGSLTVTATPALHGPEGAEEQMGRVSGFWLSADDLPTVYLSGDNASLDVVADIRRRLGPADIALLFAGAATIPAYFDGAPLTMTSADAAEAAAYLDARAVVPLHCDGWSHYTQSGPTLAPAFEEAGRAGLLHKLAPGESATL